MHIAGIEIPKKLEFGNDAHILIRKRVEHRLELLEEGMDCWFCDGRMRALPYFEVNVISWSCACGESCRTDLDGD